jgi:hypothetical protein
LLAILKGDGEKNGSAGEKQRRPKGRRKKKQSNSRRAAFMKQVLAGSVLL